MFRASSRFVTVIFTAAALTGCGTTSEMSRSATVMQVPQAESLSVLTRQFQNDVPFTVNFGFDEDFLDAEAMTRLNAQATWIIDNPNVKFRVYGHADRVGNPVYNTDLGLRRATNAVAYLVSKGINEERLEAMVSFGEDAPVIETEDRERANRRVVTEVFGLIDALPENVSRNGITVVTVGDPVPGDTSTPNDDPTPSNDPTPSDDPTPSNDPTPSDDPTPSNDPTPNDDPTPSSDPEPTSGKNKPSKGGKKPNSGRGNGDEAAGDPGNSGGHNNGGDDF